MAISNYLQKCEYKLGGLKPHIYLIHKDALTVKIKANGVKVSFNHIKKGKDEDDKEIDIIPKIYKIEGALCVYNQEETFASKYRFNSTLEVTINELYKEPFFYGLRTLRTNQYYIIIEDKKGTQYLINPELYTNLNYEYNFTDTTDGQNAVLLTWYNLSNFPLLIFENKVETDTYLLQEQLNYNLGHSFELVMSLHKDINTNDDGVKVTNLYIDSADKIKKIEYLKETFNLNETYDGNMFRVTLSYSIPLDSHQFEWHYNLLEFKDNLYTAVLRTTNDNYIVVGVENGLFPSYNITTSEEDETPNMVNITFTHLSQYPILYTDDITQFRWIPTDEICFGFDKYQMLTQQYSEDWGVTWETTEPEIKKKGDIIEANSEDCKEYQWVDDGTYCYTSSTQYVKWIATDDFVCENGDKYQKLKKHITVDGETFNPTEEYAKGNLIEKDSQVCKTIAIRWVDITDDYLCFPINEEYTRWIDIEDVCVGDDLMKSQKEEISNNGILYYESGDMRSTEIVKENCCACGYINKEYRYDSTLCSSDITDTSRIFYPSLDSTSPTYKKSYALYDKYYEWEYCYDEYATVDRKTDKYKYIVVEENSCSCDYTGLTWQWDGEEYVCGSEVGLDATSKYEVWRETNCDKFTGNISYRNPINNCECGYIDIIYKTEEGYIDLTRRKHSNGVYIDSEYEGASNELYTYRANITYSGNACLGDEIVWSMTSYEITQEYIEEEVSEIEQVHLLGRLKDNNIYFDIVNNNVYNTNNSLYFDEIIKTDNGLEVLNYGNIYKVFEIPNYSITSINYKIAKGCTNSSHSAWFNLKYNTKNTTINNAYRTSGTIDLPEDYNNATIDLRAGSTCNSFFTFNFISNDDRLFNVNAISRYEVINGKRIFIDINIDFNGYIYKNVVIPYDMNDETTYILENGERYYKLKEQFSLDGLTFYDYVNITYIKGDKITQ